MTKSRIIIFGGQGFVGLNLIISKLFNDKKIYVIGNKNKKIKSKFKLKNKNIIYNECNIFDIKSYEDLNFNNTIVIFAASNTNQSDFNLNIKKLFDYLSKFKLKKFFLLSSVSVYGNNNNYIHEKSKINPLSNYAKNCLTLETIAKNVFKKRTILYVFRITNIFGFPKKNPGLIEKFFLNNLKNKKYSFSKQKLIRSYIYIDDLIDIINFFLKKKIDSGVYNISNPFYVFSLNQINSTLNSNFKFNKKIKYNNQKLSIINSKCKANKLSKIYKFHNKFLEDLNKMKKFYNFFMANI